jgi:hypothetical protein
MKLTKGRLSKIYRKTNQSKRRFKKNKKRPVLRNTFRKRRPFDLNRKTLKRMRGGLNTDDTQVKTKEEKEKEEKEKIDREAAEKEKIDRKTAENESSITPPIVEIADKDMEKAKQEKEVARIADENEKNDRKAAEKEKEDARIADEKEKEDGEEAKNESSIPPPIVENADSNIVPTTSKESQLVTSETPKTTPVEATEISDESSSTKLIQDVPTATAIPTKYDPNSITVESAPYHDNSVNHDGAANKDKDTQIAEIKQEYNRQIEAAADALTAGILKVVTEDINNITAKINPSPLTAAAKAATSMSTKDLSATDISVNPYANGSAPPVDNTITNKITSE